MNNKGQSLVLFVVFIPIFILIFTLIFDSAAIVTESVRIKNIGKEAITYLTEKETDIDMVKKIILKNDKDIEIVKINKNEIRIKRVIDSYFGAIIGHETYELEVYYVGIMKDGKLIIEEKGI